MKVLTATLEIPIRFSETDAMGVVWHGNYLKFFEDAREHFGREFGMEYLDLYNKGYLTPIVRSEINHKASIHYGETAKVIASLEKRDSAKIIFHYTVMNITNGKLAATGSTTQVFMNAEDRTLELIKPDFIVEWEEQQNWETRE